MQTSAVSFIGSACCLENSEGFLWQSFKHGDAEALENIYLTYFDMLCFYGRQFAADDPCLVEDCIQELFIQLFSKSNRSRLSDTNSIKFYLMKSLRRSILNAQKKIARKQTKLVAEIGDFDNCELRSESDSGVKNEFLKKHLLGLPVRQRDAIYLRFYMEMEFQEIACKMKLDIRSVYKVIYKGLSNLRRMYEYNQCKSFM